MLKRKIITLSIAWLILMLSMKVQAQSTEVVQLLLNVEKLAQFKQILSDMKKGYAILSSGYNTVKDLSEGNFSLHKTFLDGLMEVSPQVKKYHKVAAIIQYQLRLVKQYKAALERFKASDMFHPGEIAYLERVYKNLFEGSLSSLDELAMVVTAGKLRMSDQERLQAIDRIHSDMEDKVLFLDHFNEQAMILALNRQKENKNIALSRALHGIDH